MEETQKYGNSTDRKVTYEYDLAGRLKNMQYPSGLTLRESRWAVKLPETGPYKRVDAAVPRAYHRTGSLGGSGETGGARAHDLRSPRNVEGSALAKLSIAGEVTLFGRARCEVAQKARRMAIKVFVAVAGALFVTLVGCGDFLPSAVEKGDVRKVKRLVAGGADPNVRDERGLAPLHYAAAGGHVGVVKVLIGAGANLQAVSKGGMTALHFAALGGQKEAVQALLSHGAQVDVTDDHGWTALLHGASVAHREIVEILLAAGAEVNAKSKDGETALQQAASQASEEVVNILLAAGADINARNDWNETALRAARGNTAVSRILLHAGAQHDIFTASALGERSLVEAFLKQNPELVRAGDGDNSTPLYWATLGPDPEVTSLLLAEGANVNARNYLGENALHVPAMRGHIEVVKLLLANGVHLDARDYAGCTPLHGAAECGSLATVELLLSAGAGVNITNTDGDTPLRLARIRDHTKVVEILRQYGARK